MFTWIWIICPKCGNIMDSSLFDLNAYEDMYSSKKDFRIDYNDEVITCLAGIELDGYDCVKSFKISECVLLHDSEL